MNVVIRAVHPPRFAVRWAAAMVAVGSAAALSLAGVAAPATAAPAASRAVTTQEVSIPVRDGVVLSGTVAHPVAAGNWPIVIMPGTFAGDGININIIGSKLAERGYVAVTYLERGFGASGGEIDAGGPKDVSDVSDALTWALANTPADPARVGVASISYGAGFAPIVAAKDRRIKAVAMVSGWGDMWASRYPNNTSAWASNVALWSLAKSVGRPSAEMEAFFSGAAGNTYTAAMKRTAQLRSPSSYLPLMRQGTMPPLYVSTSMNEMIWPADQTIRFFNDYPGAKHLDVLPGDHATTELGTPLGVGGVTWNTAFDWMDAYVGGTSAAVTALPAVRVAPRTPNGSNAVSSDLFTTYPFEGYATTAVRAVQRQYLSTTSSAFGLATTTSLSSRAGAAATTLREGDNLLLQNGIPMYQGGFEIVTGNPTTVPLAAVDQGVTGLWSGPAIAATLKLRGATRVHLDLTPSAAAGSVFVYLLEQAPDGTTYVIGHKPYSWKGATPRTAQAIDVTIPYNAYDVPAGHKVVVAVSTGDVMYTDNNPAGSTVSVGNGSFVDLPLK